MEPPPPVPDPSGASRAAEGWFRVQLAALAFIGLCGVLNDLDDRLARWIRMTAAVLVLAALALACASIFLVAGVAWPLGRVSARRNPLRRLRAGILATFASVALMALSASAGWWPVDGGSADGATASAVRVTDSAGGTACGEVLDAPDGVIRLRTDRGVVELAVAGLRSLVPADC